MVRWVENANFGLKIAICKQNIRFCKMDYVDMNQWDRLRFMRFKASENAMECCVSVSRWHLWDSEA